MADLITADELAILAGREDWGDDEELVEMLIVFAVGEIETWLGRPVAVQGFTEYVRPDTDGRVYLEKTPVVEVESVNLDGTDIDSRYYGVTTWGLEYFDYSYPFADIYDDDYLASALLVEYQAGLDTPQSVNSLVAAGVLRAANEVAVKKALTTSGHLGLKEITVEDFTVKYDGAVAQNGMYSAGASPITIYKDDADFNSIKRLKKRVIVT